MHSKPKSKSSKSSKHRVKTGSLSVPDVRSPSDIPALESLLKKGPMAVVLVYADWCGHCGKYKENVWNPLKQTPGRNVNMASVHYDQLASTSLKNAKINGYPSVLTVGPDSVPATFKNEDGSETNAMTNANDLKAMKTVVSSPSNVASTRANPMNITRLYEEDQKSFTGNPTRTGIRSSSMLQGNNSSQYNSSESTLSSPTNNSELLSNQGISPGNRGLTLPADNIQSTLSSPTNNPELLSNQGLSLPADNIQSTLSSPTNNPELLSNQGISPGNRGLTLPADNIQSTSTSDNRGQSTKVPPLLDDDLVPQSNSTTNPIRPSLQRTVGGRLYRTLKNKSKAKKTKKTKKSKSKK